MAIPSNYIDKITKGNDSRMISPAADMVRVNNDNFEGADLNEVLDEVAQDINNAGSGAVSVTTNQDGTFVIHVGETDYTINLNHTHENMAKIVKCTEATLPQTLADDTIYVQVDSANPPTEIEKLYLFGLEFTGGGAAPGTPAITKPSGTTINLGENSGSGVSKSIEIKANAYITGDLTVGLAANSDLSFDTTNLPIGVTYNSGAGTLTIAQATAMQGANITVVYSGSGAAEIDGGLVISGGGATPKSVVVVVPGLPNGYTRLEYVDNARTGFLTDIDSVVTSGSGANQTFVAGTKWTADVQMMSSPTGDDQVILCSSFDVGHWFGALRNGHFGCGNANSSSPNNNVFLSGAVLGTRSVIEVEFIDKGIKATLNDTTCARYSTNNFNHWFGSNGGGNVDGYAIMKVSLFDDMNTKQSGLYKGKVYSIKCIHNGTNEGLFFDGIPAQRDSDNKKGLYDMISQTFYPIEL